MAAMALLALTVVHVFGWALAIIDHVARALGILGDDDVWWIVNP